MSAFHYLGKSGETTSVHLGGLGVVFRLGGQETGDAFSLVEHPIAPGTLVPPHTHSREDEYSYVLEGEVGAKIGDQEFLATPGDLIVKPRGVSHTFWNPGPQPARLLEFIAPAGFESYFEEMASVLNAGGPPDQEQIASIAEKYGLTYQMEQIPDLITRYHLHDPRAGGR
ncbi:MAG TPA: cupin domain-containing protein [Ktedonobacteraceae bacterium]